jgi:hypothetical protein
MVVSLIRGYVPVVGDTFVLLTADEELTGEFTDISLPTPPAGAQWELVSDGHVFRLTLIAVPITEVVGRHIFYNRSAFDGNNAAADANDDAAIAPDKRALLNGEKATFANYTSYSRGINAVMIDIANLADPAGLSVADFTFRTGNDNNPAGWSALALDPAQITVAVRVGAGAGGSDRVTIVLPDGAVKKTWLQVTVKATAATGLAVPDVHYWGNAVGDSGNSTSNTQVTVADALRVRANPRTAADNPAPVDFFVDYNRDKNVNIQDELIVRGNPTSLETDLNLIDLSGAGGAEGEAGGRRPEAGGDGVDRCWLLAVGGAGKQGNRESGIGSRGADLFAAFSLAQARDESGVQSDEQGAQSDEGKNALPGGILPPPAFSHPTNNPFTSRLRPPASSLIPRQTHGLALMGLLAEWEQVQSVAVAHTLKTPRHQPRTNA